MDQLRDKGTFFSLRNFPLVLPLPAQYFSALAAGEGKSPGRGSGEEANNSKNDAWVSLADWKATLTLSLTGLFPAAVIVSNNTNALSYCSVAQTSEVGLTRLKARCQQDCVPSRRTRKNLFSCFRSSLACWACGPSSTIGAHHSNLGFCCQISFYWLSLSCLLRVRTLWLLCARLDNPG